LSRQSYQKDVLSESHARLRVRTQELGAPIRMIEPIERKRLEEARREKPAARRGQGKAGGR
jgi:hypothetical protein